MKRFFEMKLTIARMIAIVTGAALSLCLLSQPVRANIRGGGSSLISKESLGAADAIYAGSARVIRGVAAGSTTLGKTEIRGQWKSAEFVVDHVVKGRPAATVSIEFFLADEPARGVLLASIPVRKRCLVLLSSTQDQTGTHYRLLDALSPVLLLAPTKPAGLTDEATESERLQSELVAAMGTDEDAVVAQAVRCIAALGFSEPEVIAALKRVSEHKTSAIAGSAVAARIQLGDATAVASARALVESGRCAEGQCHEIATALRTLTAAEHLEELKELLRSRSVLLRRGASYALRQSAAGNAEVLAVLALALDDSDREVQYNAVMGMAARAPSDAGVAPAYAVFLEEPERYVRSWREWWQASGRASQGTDSVK